MVENPGRRLVIKTGLAALVTAATVGCGREDDSTIPSFTPEKVLTRPPIVPDVIDPTETFTPEPPQANIYQEEISGMKGLEILPAHRLAEYIDALKQLGEENPVIAETARNLERLTRDSDSSWFSKHILENSLPMEIVLAQENNNIDTVVLDSVIEPNSRFFLSSEKGVQGPYIRIRGIRTGIILNDAATYTPEARNAIALKLGMLINNIPSFIAGIEDMDNFVTSQNSDVIDEDGEPLEGDIRDQAMITMMFDRMMNLSSFQLITTGVPLMLFGKYASDLSDQIDEEFLNDGIRVFSSLYRDDEEFRRSADELEAWWHSNEHLDKRGLYSWIANEAPHVLDAITEGLYILNQDPQQAESDFNAEMSKGYKIQTAFVFPPQVKASYKSTRV